MPPYTFFCAILGQQKEAFPIHLNETHTVGDLKIHINRALGSIDTKPLTLYKVNIDVSRDETAYGQAMEQIHRNAVTASEPLNNPLNMLSAKFDQSILAGGSERIHILIKLPPGQSTDPIDPSVCDAVAETVLTCPVYPSLIVYHSVQSLRPITPYRPTLTSTSSVCLILGP